MKPKPAEKSKYESKEHKEKHLKFMNKVNKLSTKETKSNTPDSQSKSSSKPHRKATTAGSKAKPTSAQPSFQDLMKLAGKMQSGEVVQPKPSSPIDSKSKAKGSNNDKHKQSGNPIPKSSNTNSSAKVPTSTKNNSTNGKAIISKSTNGNTSSNKVTNKTNSSQNNPSNATLKSHNSVTNGNAATKSLSNLKPPRPSNSANQQRAGTKRPMNGTGGGGDAVPVKKLALSGLLFVSCLPC